MDNIQKAILLVLSVAGSIVMFWPSENGRNSANPASGATVAAAQAAQAEGVSEDEDIDEGQPRDDLADEIYEAEAQEDESDFYEDEDLAADFGEPVFDLGGDDTFNRSEDEDEDEDAPRRTDRDDRNDRDDEDDRNNFERGGGLRDVTSGNSNFSSQDFSQSNGTANPSEVGEVDPY